MTTYIGASFEMLVAEKLIPLKTIYKYIDGSEIYVANNTDFDFSKLVNRQLENGIENLGAFIFKTSLNDNEIL